MEVLPALPDLNDAVEVNFPFSEAVGGCVIWTNGSEYGLALDREIDGDDLRSAMLGAQRSQHKLHPVSHIRTGRSDRFYPGLRVTVMDRGGRAQSCIVNWIREGYAGLKIITA